MATGLATTTTGARERREKGLITTVNQFRTKTHLLEGPIRILDQERPLLRTVITLD